MINNTLRIYLTHYDRGDLVYKDVIKRFLKRKTSLIGSVVILFFIFVAIFGPPLCSKDPNAIDLTSRYSYPSKEHLLGTDNLGRDMFTRLVYASRVSLTISFISVFVGSAIGIILGVLSGYYGGWVDTIISRIIDILLAFPGLLLAIGIVAILGPGIKNTIIAVGFYSIPAIARIVRSMTISIKTSEYVQACYVMGISNLRIIFTHILPNTMSQIIVNITLSLGTSILSASALSFLGLGVQPPNPEWGSMLSKGREAIREFPLAALIPGITITLVVLSFSLIGDGLRDALDPKLKNS